MVKVDWKIHYIHGDNALTFQSVGAQKYCGLEIELNLNVPAKMGMMILNTVVLRCIELNKQLQDGITVEQAFNVPIRITEKNPIHPGFDGQRVYRVIVPDKNGKFPGDEGCINGYDSQLDDFIQIKGKGNNA